MRKYTLIVSIVVHAGVACALVFTTVLASGDLPVPRDGIAFVNVAASPPPTPPPAAPPRVTPVVNPDAAPVAAPEGVRPEVEHPALVDVSAAVPDGVVDGSGPGVGAIPAEVPPPPQPTTLQPPYRTGGLIKPPARISYVTPNYPAIARAAHISGTVILEATIGEDGSVRDLRVLRSIPLLDQAAKEAVRQWRFTPTLLNGQPIAVLMTVTVSFALN